MNILQYESKIWATADLLRGSGIKESEWPSFMMPFFALAMIESRLIRMFDNLKAEIGEEAFNGIEKNLVPGGSLNNLDYVDPYTSWGKDVSESWKYCLADAQTSGGLLISVPEKYKESILSAMNENGVGAACCIGRIIPKEEKLLHIA